MFRLVGSMMLMSLFFATVGYAFHPYYRQQLLSYRTSNIFDHRLLLMLSSKVGRPAIDPSIIEHNRQYLNDKLGFSKEKLDKIAAPTSNCNILTLDIGILDDRVNWLKNRLSLTDNQVKKIIQSKPNILSIKIR